ncbi:MFS transporter [Paenibacillus barcinonensis]|uniref:MFS transporter n=1 Tax=Paenibacillus barcinonensis TaxID=198119 RepID=UPI001C0FAD98|nr:MFS transporter [Paenibacillus barcinonensis]MBU5352592.1 MFS transporter [Paenibacillus barcinonensis]
MKKSFLVIFITVLTAMISIANFNLIIGPLTRNLGLSEIQSGSLVAITGFCWFLGSFLWVKYTTMRRKNKLLLAILGYTIAITLFAFIADRAQLGATRSGALYWVFLGLRALAGFFFGAIPAIAQEYLIQWTSAAKRTGGMALFGAANGLGFVFGPVLGAIFASYSLTAPMYISAFLLIIVFFMFAFLIPGQSTDSNLRRKVKLSPWDHRIRLYISIGLVLSTMMIILQVTLGFYVQDKLSVSAQEATRMIGLASAIAGLIVAAVQLVIGRFPKWPPDKLLLLGLAFLGLGFLLFTIAPSDYMLAYALVGVGIGFTLPGYISASSLAVSVREQADVTPFASAAQGVGSFAGPVIGTTLYSFQPGIPYILCTLFAVFFLGCILLKKRSGHAGYAEE